MASIRHLHDSICTMEAVVFVAAKLWRDAQASDATVVFVLDNEAAISIMHHEITEVFSNSIPTDKVSTFDSNAQDVWVGTKGKLVLVSHGRLRMMLAKGHPEIEIGLKVALYLGCGEYTVSMLSLCVQLYHWVTELQRLAATDAADERKELLSVYTISNLEESPYLNAKSTWLCELGANTSGRGNQRYCSRNTLEGTITALVAEESQFLEELNGSVDQENRKQTNRVVVCMNPSVFKAALSKVLPNNARVWPHLRAVGASALKAPELLEYLYEDRYNNKMMSLGQGTDFIGTIKNIGTVLIWPNKSGIFFDTHTSQMVWQEDITISKAELRHAARFSDNGNLPELIIFLRHGELYQRLPETPKTAPAFAGELLPLLLELCAHGYLNGQLDAPIRLPHPKIVKEYCHRLRVKGLVIKDTHPTNNNGNRIQLTDFGKMTLWWHQVVGISNFNVACLLGSISFKDELSQKDMARASAVMRIAAVTLTPGSPLTSPISDLLRVSIDDDGDSDAVLEGLVDLISSPIAELARRGPIWAAVGVWSRLRPTMAAYDLSAVKNPFLTECNGQLRIRLQTLRLFEANFALMNQAWENLLGKPRLEFSPPLEVNDVLFVEKMMVRAWLHNIAFIPMREYDANQAFAHDIVSGIALERNNNDLVPWVSLQENVEVPPPQGKDYAGLCAIYTYLHKKLPGSPLATVEYVPEDLTFVTMRAFWHVLRECGIRIGREDEVSYTELQWQYLLKTSYPIHIED